jgi:rod shape-determining protein MreD
MDDAIAAPPRSELEPAHVHHVGRIVSLRPSSSASTAGPDARARPRPPGRPDVDCPFGRVVGILAGQISWSRRVSAPAGALRATVLSLVLAAVGATVAALVQATVLPFAAEGGGGLDLVLVIAIVWTMALGLEGGLVWAFLGGLVIDVLLMRPLGLTAFIDLLAVGAAWVVARLVTRALYPVIVGTTAALAFVAVPLSVALYQALRDVPPGVDPFAGVVGSTIAAAVTAAILAPPALAVARARRRDETERVDW